MHCLDVCTEPTELLPIASNSSSTNANPSNLDLGLQPPTILLVLVICSMCVRAQQATFNVEGRISACFGGKGCCRSNGQVGLHNIQLGGYNGCRGMAKAYSELGWPCAMAWIVATLRLLLCHLGQPAAYLFAFQYYLPQLTPAQQGLGAVVALRECGYALLVLFCVCARPAILLVDLGASKRPTTRLRDKLWYVLIPEKFITVAALGFPDKSDAAALLFSLTMACDACSIAALGVGLAIHNLPIALVVFYAIPIVPCTLGAIVVSPCGGCLARALVTCLCMRARVKTQRQRKKQPKATPDAAAAGFIPGGSII